MDYSELVNLKKSKSNWKVRFYTYLILLSAFDIFIVPHMTSALITVLVVVIINIFYIGYIINYSIKWFKTLSKIKEIKRKMEEEQRSKFGNMFDGLDEKYRKIFEDLWEQIYEQHRQRQQQYQQYAHTVPQSDKLDNAYKLLKVSKTDTVEKIKKVYRELAIKWHPDKWSTDTPENQRIAERNFKKLQSAYDLIKKDKNIC